MFLFAVCLQWNAVALWAWGEFALFVTNPCKVFVFCLLLIIVMI